MSVIYNQSANEIALRIMHALCICIMHISIDYGGICNTFECRGPLVETELVLAN